ncbi:hypothetical protein FSP39_023428, partial [Pinctada imbricata]
RQNHVTLLAQYEAVGSGTGKSAIKANVDIEYAGSDSLLSNDDRVNYPDLVEFPTMAGSVNMRKFTQRCALIRTLPKLAAPAFNRHDISCRLADVSTIMPRGKGKGTCRGSGRKRQENGPSSPNPLELCGCFCNIY